MLDMERLVLGEDRTSGSQPDCTLESLRSYKIKPMLNPIPDQFDMTVSGWSTGKGTFQCSHIDSNVYPRLRTDALGPTPG